MNRDTSCQCSVCGKPPCSWCETDARICGRCGDIVDRDDLYESGCCYKCEPDRIIDQALKAARAAPKITHEIMALFGIVPENS